MKSSIYNIFSEQDDGSVLVFNSLWGTLVKMDRDNYITYNRLLDTGFAEHESDPLTSDFVRQIKKGGLIVEDTADELDYLKRRFDAAKSSLSILKLEIVPTSSCNFSCQYCYYADNSTSYMTEEVQDALVEFVKERALNRKYLNIIWTGGEPTLAPQIIINLSRRFMEISDKYGMNYGSSIFTNGYLLDKTMAKDFIEHNVKIAQFVIDGFGKVHDERRPLVNGKGTFDVIMKNVKDVSDIMDAAIRVNLDRTNANPENISLMLDAFDRYKLPKSVTVELAQVMPYTTLCTDFVKAHGLNKIEYAQKLSELFPLIEERGYATKSVPAPSFAASPCTANSSFGISSEGDIYRCFLIIGDKRECLGNLLDMKNSIENCVNYTKWDTWSPFARKECCECAILPICMGGEGCPFIDVAVDKHLRDGIRCSPLKFNIRDIMNLTYRQRSNINAV